jgi:AraC family transcriptional regulator of arabinose operon
MSSRRESPYTFTPGILGGEFDRNRSYKNWRSKGTPDWLLIYTQNGAGRITTSAGSMTTRPGDIILYAPGERHDYATDPAVNRWHLLWVHFTPKPMWRPWLRWPVDSQGVKFLHLEKDEVRASFQLAMRRMLHFSYRKHPNKTEFLANSLEEVLLWAHVTATRGAWLKTDPRIRQAIDYLAANLRQPFRLDQLARHSHLSVSRLSHLFKINTGLTPQQFFEQQRMEHAAQLLRVTGLSIAEVAKEAGYEDAFYFSNRFRRFAQKSPSQFRSRAR